MGKVRRSGCVFLTWKSDHPPRHVHVYRDGRLVVKWDLDNRRPMKGRASAWLISVIEKLESDGEL